MNKNQTIHTFLFRMVAMLCVMALTMIAYPNKAWAQTSGTCGDNLTWTLTENGGTVKISNSNVAAYDLTITGTGAMSNYTFSSSPWYSQRSQITNITIGSDVTTIGNYAFYDCSNLLTVGIPASVTTIGNYAFQFCIKLKSITIPASVTSIGEYAFSSCTDLATIIVDGGNTIYDSRNDCNAIIEKSSNTLVVGCKNTIIPDGVTTIGDDAFYGSNLTSIDIPANVTSIGNEAFNQCTLLRSITLPEGLTSIGQGAFMNCKALKSVVIPDGVTTINGMLFRACDSLRSVTLGKGVTTIGGGAFKDCKWLTVVNVTRYEPADPNPITTFTGSGTSSPFAGCTDLVAIVVPDVAGYLSAEYSPWGSQRFGTNDKGETVYFQQLLRPYHETLFAAGSTNLWTTWADNISHAAPKGAEVYTIGSIENGAAYIPVLIKRAEGDLANDLKMPFVMGGEITPENGWSKIDESAKVAQKESATRSIPDIMEASPYGYYFVIARYVNWSGVLWDGGFSLGYIKTGNNDSGHIRGNNSNIYAENLEAHLIDVPFAFDGSEAKFVRIYDKSGGIPMHTCALTVDADYLIDNSSPLPLSINSSTPMSVGFAKEGYGTYYHRGADATLPAGMKARIVTAKGDGHTLTYETIADGDGATNTVPAGTAVMLQVAESTDAQTLSIGLTAKADNRTFASNLLHGSDVETITDGGGTGAKYYKLTYGLDNTGNGGDDLTTTLGWYWGAADGAAFTSGAHKAWLALPAGSPARLRLPEFDEWVVTGIVDIEHGTWNIEHSAGAWYSLDGRRLVGKPSAKGLYIHNGKLVIKN